MKYILEYKSTRAYLPGVGIVSKKSKKRSKF